jgi:Mg2+-importing ATPase
MTELAVVLVCERAGRRRSKPSRLLLWTTVVMSIVALAVPFLGPFSTAFGFVPLSALEMAIVLAIVAGYIVATEGAKAWFYRARDTDPTVLTRRRLNG